MLSIISSENRGCYSSAVPMHEPRLSMGLGSSVSIVVHNFHFTYLKTARHNLKIPQCSMYGLLNKQNAANILVTFVTKPNSTLNY
jgi:hypothetical protein